MSMRALLTAVKGVLVERLGLTYWEDIGIHEDGMPPPIMGQRYVAVHPMGESPFATFELAIAVAYQFAVTVTWRIAAYPKDWRFERLLGDIEPFLSKIRHAIDDSYQVLMAANENIDDMEEDGHPQGFITPPRWLGTDAPVIQGSDWLLSPSVPQDNAFLVVRVNFGDAKRIFPH